MLKFFYSGIMLFSFYSPMAQSDSLTEYTGSYKFPEGSPIVSLNVSIEEGHLYIISSIGSAPMVRTNKDTFSIPAYYNARVWFLRKESSIVQGIHIEAAGSVIEGEKQNSTISYDRTIYFRGHNRKFLIFQPLQDLKHAYL